MSRHALFFSCFFTGGVRVLTPALPPARVELEDGAVFAGRSFSVPASAEGEVVFNTGMVGYPQALTDPSYRGQLLVLTYPLVGNYGVPARTRRHGVLEHFESERIQVAALVVASYSFHASHWSARQTLRDWLVREGVPAVTGVDTRALTRHLRARGTLLGRVLVGGQKAPKKRVQDPNERNLVAEVSCKAPRVYGQGKRTVAVVDTGVKNNILHSLLARGLRVLRVPWNYDPLAEGERVQGVVFANGPGDPRRVEATVEACRSALDRGLPVMGICLGNQVLARAIGLETYKLKYGHRSQNQPCRLEGTRRAFVTSQNHGFAVRAGRLPRGWRAFFTNLNDGTNEGLRHTTKPFFSVQFHPEAMPGPTDTAFLFDRFAAEVRRA